MMLTVSPHSDYAPVNGLRLYYEVHGTGRPLILLHGGFGSTAMFAPILPQLAENHQAIAVDLQAHGRTADIDRPMTFEAMAGDIAALLKHLGIDKADVLGYSLGAAVALRTAIQHPEAVRKLVAVSHPCRKDGWFPEVNEAIERVTATAAKSMKPSPLYRQYSAVAPRPEDWPVLVRKLGGLVSASFDWTAEIPGIQPPTMLVFGDADSVQPSHIVEFYGLLGGGKGDAGWDGSGMSKARLAILPGLTHYNILSPALTAAVTPFLDAPI